MICRVRKDPASTCRLRDVPWRFRKRQIQIDAATLETKAILDAVRHDEMRTQRVALAVHRQPLDQHDTVGQLQRLEHACRLTYLDIQRRPARSFHLDGLRRSLHFEDKR